MISRTPVTIARTPKTSPLCEKVTPKKGVVSTPNKISQMASSSIPKLFGTVIGGFFS
jgi:hypothetical protein